MKYRKRPIVIEAVQLPDLRSSSTDEAAVKAAVKAEVMLAFEEQLSQLGAPSGFRWVGVKLKVPTLEGDMMASPGDYIIKGVSGEFYPCKPDIFEQTYDEVLDNA